jgi:hypothetical protein
LPVLGLALLMLAARECRDLVLARNFRAVVPGAVYRGAELRPGPLRRVVERHGIRTVLCLVDPERSEHRVTESLGARWIWAPLDQDSASDTFDALERIAALLAEPANQPVFFHCKRGIYRSNLVQAVYRMKHCGWTLREATEELRAAGYSPERSGGDNSCAELLARYHAERCRPDAVDGP